MNARFPASIRLARSVGGALTNSLTRLTRDIAALLAAAPAPYARRYTLLTASRPLTAAGRYILRLAVCAAEVARFQASPIHPSFVGSNGSQSNKSG